jgi:uncharacterized protein YndB with AHSA1/START domain
MTQHSVIDATADRPHVRVVRRFKASAERVFDSWVKPELLEQWMFNPTLRGEEVLRIAVDARVGGMFSFAIRRNDQKINHIGKYLEINRPQRLVFTWATVPDSPEPEVASRVTVEIVAQTDGCELTLTHEVPRQWADRMRMQRIEESWTQELGVMAGLLS